MSHMLKKILIPLSLKESHRLLSDMAGFIKHSGTVSVCLCHVNTGKPTEKQEKIERSLREAASLFGEKELQTEILIRHGSSVAHEVCEMTAERQVDYIGIPWKRKNVFKRTILSSPDIDILRICRFPTLIFKSRRVLENHTIPETIVYATDCQETDTRVLSYLKLISFRPSTLYIMHIRERAPDPLTDRRRQQELLTKLDRLADQCQDTCEKVESVVFTGSVRPQISRKARKLDADLVVIGRNDKNKPMDKLLGSTAESLPHKTHCSLLIIG